MVPNEELHRHAAENLERADALLFGRVTYEMMEAAWRSPTQTQTGARPDWMLPVARTIDAAKEYVMVTDSELSNPGAVLFAAVMLAWTRKGESYSESDYRQWLTDAGLAWGGVHGSAGMPASWLFADKP